MSDLLLELVDVAKAYGGLRPLRISCLRVMAGDQIAITGIDQPGAEVLINLLTGASLPDAGTVRVFGRPTSAIADSADWFSVVDRFGIVAERAVLLEGLSVVQNLAMPFTLDIEPPPPDVRRKAEALAREVNLDPSLDDCRVGDLIPSARARVRLARGLALDPAVLLLEHPTATVPRSEVPGLGRQIRRLAGGRRLSAVSLTADQPFAHAVARRVLSLDPVSGRLSEHRRGWFSR